ncbi:MAG: hypothetical protein J0L93_04645 [Deltaproteobacteria bacterium]|nr:hypothetical protein [Deltaproteobacteria bacterium]
MIFDISKKILSSALIFLFCMPVYSADQKVKDFRSTNQKVALLGMFTEGIDEPTETKLVQDFRKSINRYSRSYGTSSIAVFSLQKNDGKKFFRPSEQSLVESQKKFLISAAKDNSVDIIVLGSLRRLDSEIEAELQLYDQRIDTASAVEKAHFPLADFHKAIETLVYRTMNYMDRDGYVHMSGQDFLEPPASSNSALALDSLKPAKNEFSINPSDLSSGALAGDVSIGGEKTPFWETWWFWTILGGSLITAGSLTYYFAVVDQPPKQANVHFNQP